MTRSLAKLTIISLATLTLGAAAVYAQTKAPAPATCGVETWSTDQMTYVTTPCTGGSAAAPQAGQTANPQNAATCGPETWSTDKMTYVGTPCAAGNP